MKSKLKYSATLWQQLNYDPIIMDYIGGHSEALLPVFSYGNPHYSSSTEPQIQDHYYWGT